MPNEHTSPSSTPATDRAPSETPRSILVPQTILANLLHHAETAAHLVGHLDDDKAHPGLVAQLGEHIDTIAHGLTEILGAPDPDAVARDGAPRLKAITGGAP